jgi:hypothetical protein
MAIINFNSNPSDRELRQFAAIWFPLFCVVIAAASYYAAESLPIAAVTLTIGVLGGIAGYAHPGLIRPVFLAWMAAAYPIGWTVSHTLLAIIYYLLMTPIGWIMRAVGYDPLQRRFDRGAHSYWVPVEPADSKSRYFRQF